MVFGGFFVFVFLEKLLSSTISYTCAILNMDQAVLNVKVLLIPLPKTGPIFKHCSSSHCTVVIQVTPNTSSSPGDGQYTYFQALLSINVALRKLPDIKTNMLWMSLGLHEVSMLADKQESFSNFTSISLMFAVVNLCTKYQGSKCCVLMSSPLAY